MSEDRDWNLIHRARRQAAKSREQSDDSAAASLIGDDAVFLPDSRMASDRFTNYRLIGEIHRGGQGVVYKATQLSTQREVAIKVLLEGPFAGPSDRNRFEREIQVLAGLRHPNIVTIHDSGTTAGFFYFVMDYIAGSPLDEYVRDKETVTGKGLGINERLQLCAKICNAVNVAHLRGVIHRDLKPGNIRVDHDGEPHILDFGLAKLSEVDASEEAETVMRTVTGQFVGSLPWASPEQTEGRTEEIDVRTDVYSLGVLTYQILTGTFPYSVIGNMREVADNIVNAAPTPLRTHCREISDEIETIVLKCLSKEPTRRYQSAGELARDIRRYLNGEAIDAKRDSTTYLLRKQLRKHKVPFTFAFALFISIVGFSIWMGFLYSDARAARDNEMKQRTIAEDNLQRAEISERESRRDAATAKEMTRFLAGLFEHANPTEARGEELTVGEMLDEGERQLRYSLFEQPEVRMKLLNTIAIAYRELGRFEESRALLELALEDHREELGPDHPLIARSLHSLARLDYLGTDHDEAVRLALEALEMRQRLYGDTHPQIAESLAFLGVLYMDEDGFDEAESHFEEALEMLRNSVDDPESEAAPTDVAICLSRLASLYEKKGEFDEAESRYREALSIYKEQSGDMHPDAAATLGNLAMVLQHRRDYAGAEALLKEALEIFRRVYSDGHPRVATGIHLLGTNYYHTGAYDEAEKLFEEALEIRRSYWGDEHDEVATTLNNLAVVKSGQGDHAGAQLLLEEVLRIYRKLWGDDHSQVGVILNSLAAVSRQQRDYAESAQYYREALEIGRKHFGDHHPNVRISLAGLGMMLMKSGDVEGAEPVLRDILSMREQTEPRDEWKIALARSKLGECLIAQEQFEEAEPLVVDTYATIEDHVGNRDHLITYQLAALQRIVRLYEAWNKPVEADEWRGKLRRLQDSINSRKP